MKTETDRKRAVSDFYTEYFKGFSRGNQHIFPAALVASGQWVMQKGLRGISPLSICLTPGEGLVRIETEISSTSP